jgi:hypothetical protein
MLGCHAAQLAGNESFGKPLRATGERRAAMVPPLGPQLGSDGAG